MSEGYTFRTATVGGFNRKDVIDYITATAKKHREELDDSLMEIESLRASLSIASEKNDSLEAQVSRFTGDQDTAAAQALKLNAEIQRLNAALDEATELKKRFEAKLQFSAAEHQMQLEELRGKFQAELDQKLAAQKSAMQLAAAKREDELYQKIAELQDAMEKAAADHQGAMEASAAANADETEQKLAAARAEMNEAADAHTAQLEALKADHQAELAAQADDAEQKLAAVRAEMAQAADAHAAQLEALKAAHQAELAAQADAIHADMAAEMDAIRAEMDTCRTDADNFRLMRDRVGQIEMDARVHALIVEKEARDKAIETVNEAQETSSNILGGIRHEAETLRGHVCDLVGSAQYRFSNAQTSVNDSVSKALDEVSRIHDLLVNLSSCLDGNADVMNSLTVPELPEQAIAEAENHE